MYGYIYKTTCLINGKIYVGQKRSQEFIDNYYGSGIAINKAINKYGIENFKVELICWCKNKKELDSKECYWIATLNSRDRNIGYNIAFGGDGGEMPEEVRKKMSEKAKANWQKEEHKAKFIGQHRSEEAKKKMSKAKIGHIPWINGKHHTEESKKKMSDAAKLRTGEKNGFYGKTHSEKTKKRISESHKGKPSAMKGKHHTEESKKKMSESHKGKPSAMKGKPLSEDTKQKLSISHLGKTRSEESKKKQSETFKKMIWINKDGKSSRIKVEDFEKYQILGYKRGRK